MVACFGGDCSGPDALLRQMATPLVPILRLDPDTVAAQWPRLQAAGWLTADGLTDSGLALLQGSPWWGYAQRLREELA